MVELKVKQNAGYEIISQIALDRDLFVLGKMEAESYTMYVTWNSGDGLNFYHGHYFKDDYEAAVADLFERAGYVQKSDKTPRQMLEEQGYFGIVMWSDEDLAVILEAHGIKEPDKYIETFRKYIYDDDFCEVMIERGSEYLYSAFYEAKRNGEFKKEEK